MKFIVAYLVSFATVTQVFAVPAQVVMMQPDQRPDAAENNNVLDVIPNQYIVMLKEHVSLVKHQESFLDHFDSINEEVRVGHYFPQFTGYSVEVTDKQLLKDLHSHPDVETLEPDRIVSIAATQKDAIWNLKRISQRDLPLANSYIYADEAGAGVDAYVVDSGIWYSHSEFEGRAKFGASFVLDGPLQDDPFGHGTHVAGTIGAKTFGVAKKVTLIGVQVLDDTGHGTWSAIIAGLNWAATAIKKSGRPSVINVSISGGKSDAVNSAINNMVKKGIHVVVAAGNNGRDACKESPASAAYAITVGSINQQDEISGFSNFGSCVDIFAPGESILSAWTGNNYAAAWDSGTSMASPHVAGVKALWLSQTPKISLPVLDAMLRKMASSNTIEGLNKWTRNLLVYNNPPDSLQMHSEAETTVEGIQNDTQLLLTQTEKPEEDSDDDQPIDNDEAPMSAIEQAVANVQTFFDALQ